jgi:orotate phosphoribosyltransferase
VKRDELAAAIREHAYLEGDFVLRSGRRSSYYLDKYRFETQPGLLAALGEHIAAAVAEHEPEAVRGPELGAVALATAASPSGIPFRSSARDEGLRDGEPPRGCVSRARSRRRRPVEPPSRR